MADSTIGSLAPAYEVFDSDLFVLEQGGYARKLSGQTLASFIDRSVYEITVTQLPSTSQPTATYNRTTGRLVLGIPRGVGLSNITANDNNQIVFHWEDGTTSALGTVKGETGKSAYDYAVENGYTGSEPDFAQLMLDLYNAAVNEAARVQAETRRAEQYDEIYENTQEQLEKFETLMTYADSKVVNTTLLLYRGSVRIFDTVLLL